MWCWRISLWLLQGNLWILQRRYAHFRDCKPMSRCHIIRSLFWDTCSAEMFLYLSTEIFCNNYTPDTCLKVGLKGITGISNSWYNKAVQCSMQEHNIYNKKRNIIRSSQEKTNQLKLNLKHYPNRSNCRHTFFRVVLKNPQNLQGVI